MENIRNAASRAVKEADGLQSVLDSALEKGRDSWEDIKSGGEEAMTDVQERGEKAWADAEKLVRKYPTKSIGIALAVGVVAGIFLSLRCSND